MERKTRTEKTSHPPEKFLTQVTLISRLACCVNVFPHESQSNDYDSSVNCQRPYLKTFTHKHMFIILCGLSYVN